MSFLWPGRNGPAIRYISSPPGKNFTHKFPRNLVLLGSTGSIGRSALYAVEQAQNELNVLALACGRNIRLLAQQASKYRPEYLAVADSRLATDLQKILPDGYFPQILSGAEGYAKLASLENADCVLSAQAGSAGLAGTLAACIAGKVVALANKESLVMAGGALREICAQSGASILPVDSEHYALFQCIAGRGQEISQLILTASGGPFLNWEREKIYNATPEMALKHPNWSMGAKISIDSASLMNKGLEYIEAMHLFGIAPENMEILIHPQSIVHSLARFRDNSLLAQLSTPDMRLAIAGCLLWPLVTQSFIEALDLTKTPPLQFFKPDLERFPALELALIAASKTVTHPALPDKASIILNAANEKAVELFLARKIPFGEIPAIIKKAIDLCGQEEMPALQLSSTGPAWQKALFLLEPILNLTSKARSIADCK